ncbi:MAG: acetylglutamate kinase [Clostridia bacterium]|nr:acetylglutamate kinase [Clostridia bacterium]
MVRLSNAGRAEVLTQALPYIQKYNGKVIVVKYGGNAMISQQLKEQVMEDIVLLSLVGVKVVLVHGGGPEITEMLQRIGKKSEFVDGLRVTDKETAEVVQMVLAGKINKSLVNLLGHFGGRAVGISGMDAHMIEAEVKDERLGYVGKITKVDVSPIQDLFEKGYIPVVSTVGCDRDGNVYNVNADMAAARIAGELKAERLITMTDIEGVLRDKNDHTSLIPCIDLQEAAALFESGIISGGMIPKVECCIDAIRMGAKNVTILDGRVPHALLIETMTDEGAGTMFVREKKDADEF